MFRKLLLTLIYIFIFIINAHSNINCELDKTMCYNINTTVSENGVYLSKSSSISNDFSNEMDKVFLQENIVDGKNILSSDMISQPNTHYIIRYDYDLQNTEFKIPDGCFLDFQGGSFINGIVKGNILNEYIRPEWFGAKGDGITDDSEAISKTFKIAIENLVSKIKLTNKYYIGKTVFIDRKTDEVQFHRYLTVEGGEFIIGTTLGFDTNLKSSHLIKFNDVNFIGTDNISKSSTLFSWKIIRLNFNGCHFDKLNYGVVSEKDSYYQSLYFNNCRVSRIPSVFIGADKDFAGSAMYDISFINVLAEASKGGTFFDYNARYAGTNIRFIACCLEGLKTAIKANAINQLLVLGCYFEGNNTYDIAFYKGYKSGSNNKSSGVTIASCCFYPDNNIRKETPHAVYWDAYCEIGIAYNNIAPGYKLHNNFNERNNNIDLTGEYHFLSPDSDTKEPYYRSLSKMGKIQFGNPKEATTASMYRAYNKGEISFNPNPTDVSGIGWICEEQGSWELSKWRAFGQLLPENPVIPIDGNFNDYKERGTYRTFSQSHSYSDYRMTNAPVQASGILEVIKAKDNIVQYFHIYKVNPSQKGYEIMTWTRQYNIESGWFSWILDNYSLKNLSSNVADLLLKEYPNINDGTYVYCYDKQKPLYKTSKGWIDHNGNPITANRAGSFANRPKPINGLIIQLGSQYFCTDRRVPESTSYGIMIYHKGNDVWVDALGRIVE